MNIKMNNYLNQIHYTAATDEKSSKPYSDRKTDNDTKSGTNKDTVSISVEGQQFAAERKASDSEMESVKITSDLDSFRNAVKSMNEPLPVDEETNWVERVDPYRTFTNLAKAESRLKQLADPNVSHKDEDMERVAEEYAKSKIDILIEKKKAMLEAGTAKSISEEYAEYKAAYDAYHSENGESMAAMMTGDTQKAYNIYKSIIDGTSVRIEDEEFLVLHNPTMYVGAKSEYYRKAEELYYAEYGKYAGR